MKNDAGSHREAESDLCPGCHAKGVVVKPITLESLLKPESKKRMDGKTYRFCETHDCDIVYYTEDGANAFLKPDLVVRVGIKETETPRPICYCFNHTIEEIEEQVRTTGKSRVIDDIKTGMKIEGCHCDTRNPRGGCCLGTVAKQIEHALAKYGKEAVAASERTTMNDCCTT